MRVAVTNRAIPRGYQGTRETLIEMTEFAIPRSVDERLINLATRIVRPVASHDHRGELEAIQTWTRNAIAYRWDPIRTERVQDPIVTLRRAAGDCDDHAVVVVTLGMAIGIPMAFTTITRATASRVQAVLKSRQRAADLFHHVYAAGWLDRCWVAADTAMPWRVPLGWEATPEDLLLRVRWLVPME